MDIFQERGHQADVKNNLSVEQLHGIVGNYDGMVIRSATKVLHLLSLQPDYLRLSRNGLFFLMEYFQVVVVFRPFVYNVHGHRCRAAFSLETLRFHGFTKAPSTSLSQATPELLAKATNMKVIGRAGVGIDNIDVAEATRKGVLVMNTPGGNTVSTAQLAISLLCSAAR